MLLSCLESYIVSRKFPGSKLLNENNWIPASTSSKWRSDIGIDKFVSLSTTSESKGYSPETKFPYWSNWCIKISILEANCHACDSMFHLAIQLETSIVPVIWGREMSSYYRFSRSNEIIYRRSKEAIPMHVWSCNNKWNSTLWITIYSSLIMSEHCVYQSSSSMYI